MSATTPSHMSKVCFVVCGLWCVVCVASCNKLWARMGQAETSAIVYIPDPWCRTSIPHSFMIDHSCFRVLSWVPGLICTAYGTSTIFFFPAVLCVFLSRTYRVLLLSGLQYILPVASITILAVLLSLTKSTSTLNKKRIYRIEPNVRPTIAIAYSVKPY